MIARTFQALLGDDRYRRAAMTTAAAGAASAASVGLTLLIVPLLLHHLGAARFGMWMTIYSFVSMLSFLDLGVGLGLMNGVAYANGRDDRDLARRYVSSGLAVLLGISLVLFAGILLVGRMLPWARVLNVGPNLAPEATAAATALLACIALAIPANVGARVQVGYQAGFLNSLWDVTARLGAAIGVLVCVSAGLGVPAVVLAVVGVPVLTGALNTVLALYWRYPWLRPSYKLVTPRASGEMMRRGGLFLVLQLVVSATAASDNLVVAQIAGPVAVAQFAVPRTLYQFVFTGMNLVLFPLWPAYGEAIARGDYAWVRKTIRGSLLASFGLSVICAGALTLFNGFIVGRWVGKAVPVPPGLSFALMVWTVVNVCGTATAMLMNAANMMRFQVVASVLLGVVALAAKVYFGSRFGVVGMVWATSAATIVISSIPELLYLRRWLRRQASTETDQRSGVISTGTGELDRVATGIS